MHIRLDCIKSRLNCMGWFIHHYGDINGDRITVGYKWFFFFFKIHTHTSIFFMCIPNHWWLGLLTHARHRLIMLRLWRLLNLQGSLSAQNTSVRSKEMKAKRHDCSDPCQHPYKQQPDWIMAGRPSRFRSSCLTHISLNKMATDLAVDNFRCIFLTENVWILIKWSLKFVLKSPINNIPVLVQIMDRRPPGDKPLSEPMLQKGHFSGLSNAWELFKVTNKCV